MLGTGSDPLAPHAALPDPLAQHEIALNQAWQAALLMPLLPAPPAALPIAPAATPGVPASGLAPAPLAEASAHAVVTSHRADPSAPLPPVGQAVLTALAHLQQAPQPALRPAARAPLASQHGEPSATTMPTTETSQHHQHAPPPSLPAGIEAAAPAIAAWLVARLQPDVPHARRPSVFRREPPPPDPHLIHERWSGPGCATRMVAFTDRRPVPLDIDPLNPASRCWRLDDTQALILVGSVQAGSGGADDAHTAEARAHTLHRALMAGVPPLAALAIDEGFGTWEGSPLWLRLAGIPKPAPLGVLPSESEPAWIEVMRTGPKSWQINRRGSRSTDAATALCTGPAASPRLAREIVYGNAGGLSSHSHSTPVAKTSWDAVWSRFAERTSSACRMPFPASCRAQEAFSVVFRATARAERLEAAGMAASPVARAEAQICRLIDAGPRAGAELGSRTDPRIALIQACGDTDLSAASVILPAYAAAVLARVTHGDLEGFDSLDGLALAYGLARLPIFQLPTSMKALTA